MLITEVWLATGQQPSPSSDTSVVQQAGNQRPTCNQALPGLLYLALQGHLLLPVVVFRASQLGLRGVKSSSRWALG